MITDLKTTSIKITKSIYDDLWQFTAEIDKSDAPPWWHPVEITVPDHQQNDQTIFKGLVPGSTYVFEPLGNKTTAVGYDMGWYLTQQFIQPEYQNFGLDDVGAQHWRDVIIELLGGDNNWEHETGIEPFRMDTGGGDHDKRFSFPSRTTKMKVIEEIANHCNYIFEIKPRWTGHEWISSAYFIPHNEVDSAGSPSDFNLPAPITITNPDPHLISINMVDDLGTNRYNRIIVRGHDKNGNWFTGIQESPNVTSGEAIPREYYEESSEHDTQSKCDIRAHDLYALYNIVSKILNVTFKDRTDLRLYQKIKFEGYHTALDISEEHYRITEISYELTPAKTLVHITCSPDRLDRQSWYREVGRPDMVGETEIIATNITNRIPGSEVGKVVHENEGQALVQLEKGGFIEARCIESNISSDDTVFAQAQKDGSYVISSGNNGAQFSPAPSDLDMQDHKILSTTGDLTFKVTGENRIIFRRD
ncbi:hypothetical protein [Methanosalsum natronophilum]|uniref:hypothetical protein n=1 Tax=Methanosalsum natronophilum TaxID=768733 RepID=UPI0021681ED4|nr:hypothetical protein [Methanosalsum natronophilum]MCS3924945.1 hypothetical protein [Methanosalsum natronophilum]